MSKQNTTDKSTVQNTLTSDLSENAAGADGIALASPDYDVYTPEQQQFEAPVAGILQRQVTIGSSTDDLSDLPDEDEELDYPLQAKLAIGAIDDPYEQEADAVAEQIMRMPASGLQRQTCACGKPAGADGMCADCQRNYVAMQRSADASQSPTIAPPIVHEVLQQPGQPLDDSTRNSMESRFGTDFSQVKVHTDDKAAASARAVQARAYTVGTNMVFDTGQYAPDSSAGKRLLAHELTHVIQQTGGTTVGKSTKANNPHAIKSPVSTGQVKASIQRQPQGEGWFASKMSRAKNAYNVAKAELREAKDAVVQVTGDAKQVAGGYVEKLKEEVVEVKNQVVNTVGELKASGVQAADNAKAKLENAAQVAKAIKRRAEHLAVAAGSQLKKAGGAKLMHVLGNLKGVTLEAASLLDIVLWLGQKEQQLIDKAVEMPLRLLLKTVREEGVKIPYSDDQIIDFYEKHFGWKGRAEQFTKIGITQKEANDEVSISVAGAFSELADKGAESIQKSLGIEDERGLLFTEYELGELEGAVGAQVGLAFIGVKEVQIGLKVIGAIGPFKGLFDTVEKTPNWKTDWNFWISLINIVLNILGLHQNKVMKKVVAMLSSGNALLPLIPIFEKLYADYWNPELAKDNIQHKKVLAQDVKNLVVTTQGILMALIHANSAKSGRKEPKTPNEAPGTPSKSTTPATSEPSTATKAPVVSEPPAAIKAPVVTEPPTTTKTPVVTEPSVAATKVPAAALVEGASASSASQVPQKPLQDGKLRGMDITSIGKSDKPLHLSDADIHALTSQIESNARSATYIELSAGRDVTHVDAATGETKVVVERGVQDIAYKTNEDPTKIALHENILVSGVKKTRMVERGDLVKMQEAGQSSSSRSVIPDDNPAQPRVVTSDVPLHGETQQPRDLQVRTHSADPKVSQASDGKATLQINTDEKKQRYLHPDGRWIRMNDPNVSAADRAAVHYPIGENKKVGGTDSSSGSVPPAPKPSPKSGTLGAAQKPSAEERITLYHGTNQSGFEALGGLTKGNISATHSRGEHQDFSRGFYLSEDISVAEAAARVRSRQVDSKQQYVMSFELPVKDLGVVVDIRRGGAHRQQWDAFLDRPLAPELPHIKTTVREHLATYGVEQRGIYFEKFLESINMQGADAIHGPIGDVVTTGAVTSIHGESTQIVIRSQTVADKLNAMMRGEGQ